jgi:hypothetical protein
LWVDRHHGKLGVDNVEFLIKNEGIGDRGWEGDEKSANDWLVRRNTSCLDDTGAPVAFSVESTFAFAALLSSSLLL